MSNAILTALVNGALVSALLAATIRIGLALAPRHFLSASARYALWWMALAVTAVLPLAYLRIPHAQPSIAAHYSFAPMASPAALPATPPPSAVHPVYTPAAPNRMNFPVVFTAGAWSRWFLIAWSAISSLMLLRLAASCLLLEGRKRGAVPIEQRAGIPVMASDTVKTPVLAGLRHPAILLPTGLMAQLEADELQQIVLHESAHLARRDDYALLVQRALQALFAIHPVVHAITRQIDLEREIACDEAVVSSTGLPRRYALCLTRVVELCGGVSESWVGAGVAGRQSQLAQRVDRLLSDNAPRVRSGRARLAVAFCFVAGLAALAVRMPGAIALTTPAPAVTPAQEVVSPAPAAVETTVAAEPAPTPDTPMASPVVVDATVQDGSGISVNNLTKENFQVLEDNVPQEITGFEVRKAALSLGILVDVSGSMRDKQALVNLAVMQLVKSADPATEFTLLTFNHDVKVLGKFTGDPTQIQNALNQTIPKGGTAIYDAIQQALQRENTAHAKRKLVVISDGIDNSSTTNLAALKAQLAMDTRIPIFAITLASPDTYRSRKLQELVAVTHTQEFVSDAPSQVADVAASLATDTTYILKYQSKNGAADGSYRKIVVKLPQAPQGLRITHRDGYYADGK